MSSSLRKHWLGLFVALGSIAAFSIWLYVLGEIVEINGKPALDIQLVLSLIYVEVPLGVAVAWLVPTLFERRWKEEERQKETDRRRKEEREKRVQSVIQTLREFDSDWDRVRDLIISLKIDEAEGKKIRKYGDHAKQAITKLRNGDVKKSTLMMTQIISTNIQNYGNLVTTTLNNILTSQMPGQIIDLAQKGEEEMKETRKAITVLEQEIQD